MSSENSSTELYSEQEIDILEAHIERYFGAFHNVFHEIVSPDIHVDIALIPPTPERNYHTLVTMGMGAHRMNTPPELAEYRLERAEMMICLPPDWNLQSQDERDYWPLRWLKIMARFPGEQNTWLGWGHTVPAGSAFAENTELCGMLVLGPGMFPREASQCEMPDGSAINFYQLIPLYQDEMDFKIAHNAEALLERMSDKTLEVVDIHRPSLSLFAPEKSFAMDTEEIADLLEDWNEAPGCIASDRITVDGCKVGYLYREQPDPGNPQDSGWRFAAGDETPAYLEQPGNLSAHHLNTICNYDPDIIPLLKAPYGTSYFRDVNGDFHRER